MFWVIITTSKDRLISNLHKELANKYLDESKMAYLVVGDATTQFAQFKDMGFDDVMTFGDPVDRIE